MKYILNHFSSFLFMTLLAEVTIQSCSLRNISCVNLVRGVLDFGQSSRVTVAVWGCQQELQCCHLLEVVGWGGNLHSRKKKKNLINCLSRICTSTYHSAANTTLCRCMHVISQTENKRLWSKNAFVLLKTGFSILFSDLMYFCLHK